MAFGKSEGNKVGQHWITHRLVEKNKKIRLAAAKKTIATLEGENSEDGDR